MRKIRFIKQKDSMHCGVACVRMLCDYYGLKLSEKQISNLLQPNNSHTYYRYTLCTREVLAKVSFTF